MDVPHNLTASQREDAKEETEGAKWRAAAAAASNRQAYKCAKYTLEPEDINKVIMLTGEAMRHLIAEVGIEHVVMGTDYPFPSNTAPADHILSIPGINDADKIAILGGTVAELFGIA